MTSVYSTINASATTDEYKRYCSEPVLSEITDTRAWWLEGT